MPEKCGNNEGENYFSPLWCLIKKLDHNSGLHAKNQREISKNEVRTPPTLCMEMWTFPFDLKRAMKSFKSNVLPPKSRISKCRGGGTVHPGSHPHVRPCSEELSCSVLK